MAFHVGQKVVCVDDSPSHEGTPAAIVLNAIYTIKSIGRGWSSKRRAVVDGVTLVEVEHPVGLWRGWTADRFRPVVERKTDISIFTRMLVPSELSNVD